MVSDDLDPRSGGGSAGQSNEPARVAAATGANSQRFALAALFAGLAAISIGWLAFLISRAGVAPAVLFPLGIGLAVGAVQTAIARKLRLSLPSIGAAALALACGLMAVAAEDCAGYRDYRAGLAKLQSGNALASALHATSDQWQPIGLAAYLSAVIHRDPIWWSVDAVLTPLAATAACLAMNRRAGPSERQPPEAGSAANDSASA